MLRKVCFAGVAVVTMLTVCQSSQAQMFFEADWLYYGRDNDSSKNVVTGSESLGLSDADFDMTSGYRLVLGGSLGEFGVDASFSQLDSWNGGSSGTFTNLLILDDTAGLGTVDPGGTANSLASFTALSQAARFSPMMMGPDDETTESERLRAYTDPFTAEMIPLSYSTYNTSNFREFEINIGTRRDVCWWRCSVGYRHLKLDERSGLTIAGAFDALDVDDGNPFDGTVNDDPNNALSNTAITSTGLANISGAADGFDAIFVTMDPMMAIPADYVAYQILGNSNNELNGAQVTSAIRIFNGEWITIEGIGKAGIYRNNVSGSVQETVVGSGNDDSIYQRTLTGNDSSAAFAGNLGIRGIVSLTDYINIIVGYDVLFLSGVAIGSEQPDGLSTDIFGATRYKVQNDGTLVAYGSNIGFELLW